MIRLAVRVRREHAEIALAELLDLAPGGVEETDRGELVEYAVYGAPGELPELPTLRAAAGAALVEVETTEVADDWAERWREFHRPTTVGGRVGVRAPWHEASPDLIDVVIDPGRAFGTGGHPTTRLCLELLLGPAPQDGPVADWGTGSGVLAIAAAKLGFGPVIACDHDPAALEAAAANAAANRVELDLRRVDLRRQDPPLAPVVTANLAAPLLRELAPRLAARHPRALIASGLPAGEGEEVARTLAGRDGRVVEVREAGGWTAALVAWDDPPE